MKVKSRFGHLNQEFEVGNIIYIAQNSKLKLFPTTINKTQIDKHLYITMEKLDGDITNIHKVIFTTVCT